MPVSSSARVVLRMARNYFFNVATATIGTNIVDMTIAPMFHPKTWAGVYMRETFLSAVVALGLGWLVYFKWRFRSALWVWPVGLLALAWRLAIEPQSFPVSIEYATLGFVSARAVCYSLGALLCHWFSRTKAESTRAGPVGTDEARNDKLSSGS